MVDEVENDLLSFAAHFSGRVPQQDIEKASDLFFKSEWGVGLEVLCAQLVEHEVELSTSEAAELQRLALAMNLDVSAFGLIG